MKRVRDLGRNVVIGKEPHAAKRFSNSTAGAVIIGPTGSDLAHDAPAVLG
jgi:hypothetical protein